MAEKKEEQSGSEVFISKGPMLREQMEACYSTDLVLMPHGANCTHGKCPLPAEGIPDDFTFNMDDVADLIAIAEELLCRGGIA